MAIAISVQNYLDSQGIEYDVLEHPYSHGSVGTAKSADIPVDQFAKGVVLQDEQLNYLMAVVPANQHVNLNALSEKYHKHYELISEDQLDWLFDDCEHGAIPPLGEAYGMDMVVDERLSDYKDVYFESGDHVDLIHLRNDEFFRLMTNADYAEIGQDRWMGDKAF